MTTLGVTFDSINVPKDAVSMPESDPEQWLELEPSSLIPDESEAARPNWHRFRMRSGVERSERW